MSPAEDFARLDGTSTPRDAAIGAVFISIFIALTFTAFDLIASKHLRRVIVHSVRQHADKAATMWEMSARQTFAGTICREIGGVTSGIVGGLDLLKTGGLTGPQEDVLVRRQHEAADQSPFLSPIRDALASPQPKPQRASGGLSADSFSALRASWGRRPSAAVWASCSLWCEQPRGSDRPRVAQIEMSACIASRLRLPQLTRSSLLSLP